MKRFVTTLFLLISISVFGNGVGIIDATNGTYLHLAKSDVEVNVESQIAITKATHWLVNTQSSFVNVKYGFPLGEGASAIDLRWRANGQWFQADVNEQPSDTTLPGSGGTIDQGLVSHLGTTPLYFDIPDTVFSGDTLVVELSYVELLPYSFGKVNYLFRNNYTLLQNSNVDRQSFFFTLNSPRSINVIQLQSGHTLSHLTNNGNLAEIGTRDDETAADEDYAIEYELDQNQLGLFGFSTLIPDTTLPDNLGGFFTFIAEPDPTSTATIDKVFTLIIDRSGSMTGDKIVQARNAATFIVNNLNAGDRFNIVDFASNVTAFNSEHVDFNATTQQQALNYIGQINANGGTNISGAFDVAMPQFGAANNSTANIVIFFTDGRANGGISNTQALLAHIQQLQNQTSAEVGIFTFGIGSNVNTQLLTLMASQNGGLSEFLGNDELFSRITEFYLRIRNPVLLNTQISFNPSVISEVYPDPLPNLYKGQQMIVSGRYQTAQPVTVTLSGSAFGQPVSYDYNLNLATTEQTNYSFLTKVWAKSKIEHLLVDYFSLDPNDPQAQIIQDEIIFLSLAYRVISPFTGFSGGTPVGIEDDELVGGQATLSGDFELLGNYPNPFNPTTQIRLKINAAYVGPVKIAIYNTLGQLVRTLTLNVNGPGQYEIEWDGRLANGEIAASGTYVYVVEANNTVLAGRMVLIK